MKRIISERFVTYAANEKWPSTARITIKMCDAIDQAMMQDARTCGLSYVGKANFGAAERYVREMFAEVSSPFELLFEVSAISGKIDITVLYHFATDDYLDAFIDEAWQIGLPATIVSRRPLQVAPIAAFYTTD